MALHYPLDGAYLLIYFQVEVTVKALTKTIQGCIKYSGIEVNIDLLGDLFKHSP